MVAVAMDRSIMPVPIFIGLTKEQFLKIMPLASTRVSRFLKPLNDAMKEFSIDTPLRQAAFIAQLAHESGSFRYMQEIASGEAYEFRAALGNTQKGDGKKFKGRGPIQITGRTNYLACSIRLYGDYRLLDTPELLEHPEDGCRAAGWFWDSRGLNRLADDSAFKTITRRINGGFNGLADREAFYAKALNQLTPKKEA